MNINLYPYNYYILCACLVCVILTLCVVLMHFSKLAKSLMHEEQSFNNIKNLITASKDKTNALQAKKKEDKKNNKYYKILAPILLAIYNTYRNDEELKGAKGYRKAATRVIKKDIGSNPLGFIRNFM